MSTTSNVYNAPATQQKEQQQSTGYVQSAYDAAANLATSATNAISSTLGGNPPPGSTAAATDPNTHYRNQQPHVGGVGDLGTDSETNVAMLPEEKANPEPFEGRGAADISSTNPVISDPVNIQSRLNARDPPVPYPEGGSTTIGQNESRGSNKPRTGGVGDLGTRSDADVTRLPEERANPDPLAAAPGAATSQHRSSGLQNPATRDLGSDAYKRDAHPDTLADSGNVQMGPPKGSAGWKAEGNQDRAPHSGFTDQQHATQDLTGDVHNREPRQDTYADDVASRDQSQDHGGKDGPTKMDKLKGNLLIAQGKLTKGTEKVEQGKNLKATGDKSGSVDIQ